MSKFDIFTVIWGIFQEYLQSLNDLHEDWLIKKTKFRPPCQVLVSSAVAQKKLWCWWHVSWTQANPADTCKQENLAYLMSGPSGIETFSGERTIE